MTTKETSTVIQSAPSVASYLKSHMRDYGMLIALVVIMGMFQFLTDGILMRPVNLTNLFLQNSYIIGNWHVTGHCSGAHRFIGWFGGGLYRCVSGGNGSEL